MKSTDKQKAYEKCLDTIKHLEYKEMQQVLDALYMGYCAYNFKQFEPDADDIDAINEELEDEA